MELEFLLGKNCWHHIYRLLIVNSIHTLLKASDPKKKNPAQDLIVKLNALKNLKTIPCSAVHTPLGQIMECSPPTPPRCKPNKLICLDCYGFFSS